MATSLSVTGMLLLYSNRAMNDLLGYPPSTVVHGMEDGILYLGELIADLIRYIRISQVSGVDDVNGASNIPSTG